MGQKLYEILEIPQHIFVELARHKLCLSEQAREEATLQGMLSRAGDEPGTIEIGDFRAMWKHKECVDPEGGGSSGEHRPSSRFPAF